MDETTLKWTLALVGSGLVGIAYVLRQQENELLFGSDSPDGDGDTEWGEGPSEHFTWQELSVSATADRLGLDNTPTDEARQNLTTLAVEILEPIRDAWGVTTVNSAYRSPEVNEAVGGSSTSQHMTGEAADITLSADNDLVQAWIWEEYEAGKFPSLGQAITYEGTSHVHVSLDSPVVDLSRKRFLKKMNSGAYVTYPEGAVGKVYS